MNPSTRLSPAILPFQMFWLLVSVLSVAVAVPAQAQSYPASGAESYPASSSMIQANDQGNAVSNLQQRLSELGYYSGPVNGYFDATTQEAVSRFQQANGLAADGIVGTATSSVLYQGGAASGAPSNAGAVPSGAVLQANDEGNRVTELQQQLIQRGYYNGSVTGVYDEQTKAAVIAFQRAQGLSTDGIVGSATEAALQQAAPQTATATQQTTTTESTYTPVANDGFLQLGDVGSEVSDLQTRLQNLGYYDGPISGSFGSQTQAALMAFQQAQGLTADGIAGPRVETALASTSPASPSQVTSSQTAIATTTATATTPTFTQQTVTQPTVTQPTIGQPATSSIGSTATGTTMIAPQTTSAIQPTATVQVPSLAPTIAPTTTPTLGQQPMAQSMPPSSPMSSGRPMQPRSQSDRFGVVELQRRLQLHGFDPGEITGVYGSSTQNAITQAQQAYGLSQSDLFGN